MRDPCRGAPCVKRARQRHITRRTGQGRSPFPSLPVGTNSFMSIVGPGGLRLPLKVALLCVCASTAAAQQTAPASQPSASQQNAQGIQGADNGGRRRMTALRLNDDESITLDGQLDEPFWPRVIPAKDFIQRDPLNGQPATEP